MAIYHLNAKSGSRKNGQSARAKSDYITREGKYSKDKAELVFSASGNMPEWASEDSTLYWESADTYERANGTLFRELEFALPAELDAGQRQALAQNFAREVARKDNLPYTLAGHSGKGSNPHCHLILSERMNDGVDRSPATWFKRANKKTPADGGAIKSDIGGKRKKWLLETRQLWENMANEALEHAGLDARIDHRSLADQKVDRVPQIHVGAAALAVHQKAIAVGQDFIPERIQRNNDIKEINQGNNDIAAIDDQIIDLENERKKQKSAQPRASATLPVPVPVLSRVEIYERVSAWRAFVSIKNKILAKIKKAIQHTLGVPSPATLEARAKAVDNIEKSVRNMEAFKDEIDYVPIVPKSWTGANDSPEKTIQALNEINARCDNEARALDAQQPRVKSPEPEL